MSLMRHVITTRSFVEPHSYAHAITIVAVSP